MSLLLALIAITAVPQDHAARIERLYAALPQPDATRAPDTYAQDREAALLPGNPGKQDAIAAAMRGLAACRTQAQDRIVPEVMRLALGKLSDAELDRMTEFYNGPDYEVAAAAKSEADLAPLMKLYPLQRFNDILQSTLTREIPDRVFATLGACDADADKALAAAGVKTP